MSEVAVVEASVEVLPPLPAAGSPEEATLQKRAKEVRKKLLSIQDKTIDNFLDLCDLLKEAAEGEYNVVWGYNRFNEWVEQASGLDISARQAYYCINISKKAKELGLDRKTLKEAKISKLKEIFALEVGEHAEEMRALVKAAATESLQEIKTQVSKLKTKAGSEPSEYITLKIPASVKETFDRACELARKNYGDYVENGEPTEAPIAKCLEIICVEYLQNPNHSPEETQ